MAAIPAGVLLLRIEPLEYIPVHAGRAGDAGYLWRISDLFPSGLGSSLLFWALVPLGAAAGALLVRRGRWTPPATEHRHPFPIAEPPVRPVCQEYLHPLLPPGSGPFHPPP